MTKEIGKKFALSILALVFIASVFSSYLYQEGEETKRDRKIVEFLEENYESGVVICDLDYVKEKFSKARYVSSYEGGNYNWSLPVLLTMVNAKLVIASNTSWIYEQWQAYESLLTPLAAFSTPREEVTIYEANLNDWKGIKKLVEGRIILSDDPRINQFAGRAAASWEAEKYGWRKEEFLFWEDIDYVIYFKGESTAVDELFSDEDYLREVQRVMLDREILIYEVDNKRLAEKIAASSADNLLTNRDEGENLHGKG